MTAVHAVDVAFVMDAGRPMVLHGGAAAPEHLEAGRLHSQRHRAHIVSRGEKNHVVHHNGRGCVDRLIDARPERVTIAFLARRGLDDEQSVLREEDREPLGMKTPHDRRCIARSVIARLPCDLTRALIQSDEPRAAGSASIEQDQIPLDDGRAADAKKVLLYPELRVQGALPDELAGLQLDAGHRPLRAVGIDTIPIDGGRGSRPAVVLVSIPVLRGVGVSPLRLARPGIQGLDDLVVADALKNDEPPARGNRSAIALSDAAGPEHRRSLGRPGFQQARFPGNSVLAGTEKDGPVLARGLLDISLYASGLLASGIAFRRRFRRVLDADPAVIDDRLRRSDANFDRSFRSLKIQPSQAGV